MAERRAHRLQVTIAGSLRVREPVSTSRDCFWDLTTTREDVSYPQVRYLLLHVRTVPAVPRVGCQWGKRRVCLALPGARRATLGIGAVVSTFRVRKGDP